MGNGNESVAYCVRVCHCAVPPDIEHLHPKNMKPKRIILIRHGKSEGNADRNLLETIPDYALNLTPDGIEQARQAGQEIKKIIGQETLQVYVSPYFRTRQTYQYI